MNCKNLFISLMVSTLLGISSWASADDESAIEEPKAEVSETDDQVKAEEPAAKQLSNPIASLISVCAAPLIIKANRLRPFSNRWVSCRTSV